MSKYSFEATTVGEMLDTPEIRSLVEEIMPDVLQHPLLEVGRTFMFCDAIPYIEDMLQPGQLEQFGEALAKLG